MRQKFLHKAYTLFSWWKKNVFEDNKQSIENNKMQLYSPDVVN